VQAILEALKTEEIWDDVVVLVKYWVPKLFIPVMFIAWEALGSFGRVSLSSGHSRGFPSWYFFFTGVFCVTFGAPLMLLSSHLCLTYLCHTSQALGS
jgi:hypothetical protein